MTSDDELKYQRKICQLEMQLSEASLNNALIKTGPSKHTTSEEDSKFQLPPHHRNFRCTQMPLKSITKPFTEDDLKKINDGSIFVLNGTLSDVQCTLTDTPEPISLTNKTNKETGS
jgi:hypothetical protein